MIACQNSSINISPLKRELRSRAAPYNEILIQLQDVNRQVIATTSDSFCNRGEVVINAEDLQPTLRKKNGYNFLIVIIIFCVYFSLYFSFS